MPVELHNIPVYSGFGLNRYHYIVYAFFVSFGNEKCKEIKKKLRNFAV
jgi:hypothetical protein